MEKSTIENNKLIAEFMELKTISKKDFENNPARATLNVNEYSVSEYQRYHTSWDWLMTVVEKIECLVFRFDLTTGYIRITQDHKEILHQTRIKDSESKIQAVYNAVVEFIKWHNENKA